MNTKNEKIKIVKIDKKINFSKNSPLNKKLFYCYLRIDHIQPFFPKSTPCEAEELDPPVHP